MGEQPSSQDVQQIGDGNVLGAYSSSHVAKAHYLGNLIQDARITAGGDVYLSMANGSSLSVRPEDWPDFGDLVSRVTHWFEGRSALFEAIRDFISTAPCGYFRIIADAGLGKTAIAAKLALDYHAPSYFLSASEGRTRWDWALNSLCAQIITRYGLPYSSLPERAGETADFLRKLLKEAAAHEQPVVIIIDALDEADTASNLQGHNWLHLPQTLPYGVYFVLTQRPGEYLLSHDAIAREKELIIGWDSPNQRADIKSYLRRQAQRPEIRRALEQAAPPVAPNRFVAALEEASEGNFMYLEFVLEDIAACQPGFAPLRLETLPRGLIGYYAQFWARIQPDSGKDGWTEWKTFHEPVIRLIGAAQEPLSAEWMSRLTGEPSEEITTRALRRWERFLSHKEQRDTQTTWRIIHRSFAEFLASKVDLRKAHSEIVDYYLAAWGGLEAGLVLLQDPLNRDMDNGYGVRHLTAHLQGALRSQDLHRLMRLERLNADKRAHDYAGQKRYSVQGANHGKMIPAAIFGHIWYLVCKERNDVTGYLSDVERALSEAEIASKIESGKGQLVTSMGLAARYHLVFASLHSLAANVPPKLIIALVKSGIWGPTEGLTYARQIRDSEQQTEALAGLAPYLAQSNKAVEALRIVQAIEEDTYRIQALVGLARYVPEDLLPEILDEIGRIKFEASRAEVLIKIVPHVPATSLSGMIGLAELICQQEYRAQVWAALAMRLIDVGRPQEVLQGARILAEKRSMQCDWSPKDEAWRTEALTKLALKLVDSGHGKEGVQVAQLIWAQGARSRALGQVVVRFAQLDLPREALAAARAIGEDRCRAQALEDLTFHLSETGRLLVLTEVLEEAQKIPHPDDRFSALASLLRHLPASVKATTWKRAHDAALLIPGATSCIEALLKLASQQEEPLRGQTFEEALQVARTVRNDVRRLRTLAELLFQLPDRYRTDVLREVLATAGEAFESASQREVELRPRIKTVADWREWINVGHEASGKEDVHEFLTRLAARLASAGYLNDSLAVASQAHLDESWLRSLAEEAVSPSSEESWERSGPFLRTKRDSETGQPQDIQNRRKRAEANRDADTRAKELAQLASALSEPDRTDALRDAVKAARQITDSSGRLRRLVWLAASCLSSPDRELALEHALRVVPEIREPSERRALLEELVACIPELTLRTTVGKLRASSKKMEPTRTTLMELTTVESLPADLTDGILRDTLAIVRDCQDQQERINGLGELAPYLSKELLLEALEATLTIHDNDYRIAALLILIAQVSNSWAQVILPEVRAMRSQERQTQVLEDLALSLFSLGRTQEALVSAHEIRDMKQQISLLGRLAHQLNQQKRWDEALIVANEIKDRTGQAQVLLGLIPEQPMPIQERSIQTLLALIPEIDNESLRASVLAGLAPHLTVESLHRVLRSVLGRQVWAFRRNEPEDVVGGFKDGAMIAIVLEGASSYLSDTLLYEALNKVQKLPFKEWRSPALAALVPRLAELGHIEEALKMAQDLEVRKDRVKAQASMLPYLPKDPRTVVFDQVLSSSERTGSYEILAKVASRLMEQGDVLRALQLAYSIPDERWRADGLARIAPTLSYSAIHDVEARARQIQDGAQRGRVLGALAVRLARLAYHSEALALVSTVEMEDTRSQALADVTDYLPEERIRDALEVVRRISDEEKRVDGLVAVAFHLPRTLAEEALSLISAVQDERIRAKAIAGLAPFLTRHPECLPRVLAFARAIKQESARAIALGALVEPWIRWFKQAPDEALQVWQETWRYLSVRIRQHVLADLRTLAPVMRSAGGPDAIAAVVGSIEDVGRWWS